MSNNKYSRRNECISSSWSNGTTSRKGNQANKNGEWCENLGVKINLNKTKCPIFSLKMKSNSILGTK